MPIVDGVNWCKVYSQPIDYDLVRVKKPKCIEEMKGCGGCPECTYRIFVNGEMVAGDTYADALNVFHQLINEAMEKVVRHEGEA